MNLVRKLICKLRGYHNPLLVVQEEYVTRFNCRCGKTCFISDYKGTFIAV